MKKTILFLQAAVLGLLAACSQPSGEEQLRDEIQYVNPFIGTLQGRRFMCQGNDEAKRSGEYRLVNT